MHFIIILTGMPKSYLYLNDAIPLCTCKNLLLLQRPSIHNIWIAVVVLQLVNQGTCFGSFIRPSSGLQDNIINYGTFVNSTKGIRNIGVIWNNLFDKTLFVKENIGVIFYYLNIQLLVVADEARLTGFYLEFELHQRDPIGRVNERTLIDNIIL